MDKQPIRGDFPADPLRTLYPKVEHLRFINPRLCLVLDVPNLHTVRDSVGSFGFFFFTLTLL